jgi:hypothetical protein
MEDDNQVTGVAVNLTYFDTEGDLAVTCNVNGEVNVREIGGCSCIGGVCTARITTLIADYNGPAEFSYTISDSFGTSTSKLVAVTITPVDDAPTLSPLSFAPLVFNEDTIPQPININFSYADVDGGTAPEACIISNVQVGLSGAICSCTNGSCSVSFIQDANFNGNTGFTARISNGLNSNTANVAMTVLPIDDSPTIDANSFSPATFTEDDPGPISVNFCFSDIDGYPGPNTCTVTNATVGISGTTCTCNAAPSAPCVGSNGTQCTIQTFLDPDFNGVVTFDVGLDNGLAALPVSQSITVAAVNDSPAFENDVPLVNFYAFGFNPGDENTLLETTPFRVNEEGLPPPLISYEDAQTVTLKVTSSNSTVLPNNSRNIKILWDETGTSNYVDLGFDGTNPVELTPASGNVHQGQIKLQFIPARHQATGPRTGPTTPVGITLDINDGQPLLNTNTYNFNVDFLNINNPPTINTSTQTLQGSWCQYSLALDSTSCPAQGCFDLTLDPASNGALPVSPPDGLIYYEADAGTCYYSESNAWISFPVTCPVTPSLVFTSCSQFGASCIGAGDPTTLGLGIGPVDTFFYDKSASQCYRSDGSAWAMFQTIPDVSANEKDIVRVKDLKFDEGDKITGAVDEINQELQITITSSNNILIPNKNINLRKNGTLVVGTGTEVTNYTLQAGAGDDDVNSWQIDMLPVSGQVGSSEITVTVVESNTVAPDGPLKTVTKFMATVNPVSAIHGGWANVNSVGGRVEEYNSTQTNKLDDASITITWKAFTMVGSGAGVGASVAGWNVYRTTSSNVYNFDSPLNATPLDPATLSYTDVFTTSQSTSTSGQRYYYVVRPIDSVFGLPTATSTDTPFRELMVVRPPRNMAFVHRWIANQEVCDKIKSSPDPAQNFRCPYSGPGEVDIGGTTYYDVGSHYLVDRFEVGCNFESGSEAVTCTDNDGCIGIAPPTDVIADGKLYYDRSEAKCYLRTGATWVEANNLPNISSAGDNLQFDRSNFANLPPIVNISQENAFKFCQARSVISVTGIGNSAQMRLPTRKEQIAFSAWDDTLTDAQIEEMETGLSLNSSAKCNSSDASGIAGQFENSGFPGTGNIFTLPATLDSNIRTLATGSEKTENCQSRFGIQDIIGNVDEWVIDRFFCKNAFECTGIRQGGTTNVCNFNTGEISCPNNSCIEDQDPNAAGLNITPGSLGIVFYNRLLNRCFISTGTASGNDWSLLGTGATTDDRFYFGGIPLAGDMINNFEVVDPNFDYYRMDGIRGPCNTGGNNFCDSDVIIPFLFSDESFSSGRFAFPMGLPVNSNYVSSFPFSSPSTNLPSKYLLEIGPTSGITVNNLHNDGFEFNSQTINQDPNQCGATSAGGSYMSSSKAGRYYMEVSQCTPATPRVDIGFRCVARLP